MMTISDELKTLIQTKQNIRKAITEKGVNVPDGTPFANYAERISKIGTEENINPYELLYKQRTSDETNMQGLFAYANSPELDLSVLNTSQVTNMFNMFASCTVPYLDLSGFDVSNVINMSQMFYLCSSEINIKGWDTKKLTNASGMFSGFSNGGKYLDLSVLDFSNVTQASKMFESCNIDNIDIRNINLNLAKLDWSAYSGSELFQNVKGTTLDLSNWTLDDSMTSLKGLCYFCYCKEINLTNWKTTNITNMSNMFYYAREVEKLIMPDWDMTNTTNTSSFFNSCDKLNYIDLSRSNDVTIAKIATLVPARKLATYGQIIIPADSSQANIEALVAKYWKPVGPRLDMTSCVITPEVNEFLPNDEVKFSISNFEPWYGNDIGVEYVSSDETIATVDKETMTITSTGVEGTTEITARISDTQEVISEPINFVVSAANNYPGLIRFKVNGQLGSVHSIITVNGVGKKLSDLKHNSITDTYSYNENAPITSIKFHFQNNTTNDVSEIIITTFNASNLTSMEYMFNDNNKLTSLNVNDWDTSNVENMEHSFRQCSKLTELNLSNWNTSKATTMYEMFQGCTSLASLNLSNFDTSKVNNMSDMFKDCSSLTSLDLSSFDTSNVTNMNFIFGGCNSLISLDLSNWNIEKVPSYNSTNMFKDCNSLHTLRLDNCNNATISRMVGKYVLPTNAIEGVTRKIFCKESEAAGLTAPTNWVFEFVKEEEPIPLYVPGQFENNTEITEVRTMVNDTHTNLGNMFNSCINLATINTQDWDTSNVTDMGMMFNYCHKLITLDLSSFDTSKVTDMSWMFNYCSNLEEVDLRNFNISNTTNVNGMFGSCYELHTLRLDNCSKGTINKIITSSSFPAYAIEGATRKIFVKEENLVGLTAPNGWVFVDYMTGEEIIPEVPDVPLYVSGQFENKGDITEVETMVNDTHTDLANMFNCCFNLASIIGIEDWDTSNVTTMGYMFNYCHKLTTLNLSSFDTSKVTEMHRMFGCCSNLTTVDLSNFDMTNVTYLMGMFDSCYELHTVRLDNCNNATISKIVTSSNLPTGTINGETRKIYCKEANASGLTAPNGWEFIFVE
jgi:surface protein